MKETRTWVCTHTPGRIRLLCLVALLAVSASVPAQVSLHNPTIAGGGAISESGNLRLISTTGEAAQGRVSNGNMVLTTGFPATIPDPEPKPDAIFSDGFED